MMIDDTLVQRPLYGGAAQLSFPQRFTDISDFRPVPDHQEARVCAGALLKALTALQQQHADSGIGYRQRRLLPARRPSAPAVTAPCWCAGLC